MADREPTTDAYQPDEDAMVTSTSKERPIPTPSRRRDKIQLSCHACRKRKVRCDRLLPCSNCSSRGMGETCTYTAPQPTVQPHGKAHIQDRINQLEELVTSLMQQSAATPRGSSSDFYPVTPDKGLRQRQSPLDRDHGSPFRPSTESMVEVPPSPSDYGSLKMRASGASYVSSAHWAAILDGIAGLRDHLEQDDETNSPNGVFVEQDVSPGPQLLYGYSKPATRASILEAIPPRHVVDRLVSCYFNDLEMTSGIIHSNRFLREYEEFWQSPNSKSTIWIGLLYTIICLSTQFQLSCDNQPLPIHSITSTKAKNQKIAIEIYRKKVIQCLLLGQYTNGGPHVLETLILYFVIEIFMMKDMDVGIWMVMGSIVQIAMHMGYHRDAKAFPNVSPFDGELRRRIWAKIAQLDFAVSSKLGLPRLIKERQSNTNEPRNLHDGDLEEYMTELPPSRPETEITPILYSIAKLRIMTVGTRVADLASEPGPYPYARVSELDQQIDEVRHILPAGLKWTNLSSCLVSSPVTIIQRIWLEVCIQQLKIILHRKFLVASSHQQQYAYSRSTCLNAAIKTLELQHIIDDESQAGGRLFQIRWRVSSTFYHDFLLATSILCFFLRLKTEERQNQNEGLWDSEAALLEKVKHLLRASRDIWIRSSATSREAQKALAALRYVLDDDQAETNNMVLEGSLPDPGSLTSAPCLSGFSDLMPGYDFRNMNFGMVNEGSSLQMDGLALNDIPGQWDEKNYGHHMSLSP